MNWDTYISESALLRDTQRDLLFGSAWRSWGRTTGKPPVDTAATMNAGAVSAAETTEAAKGKRTPVGVRNRTEEE